MPPEWRPRAQPSFLFSLPVLAFAAASPAARLSGEVRIEDLG